MSGNQAPSAHAVAEYNARRAGRFIATNALLAAAAAAASAQRKPSTPNTQTNRNLVTARLESNDPTLTCLKLCKDPAKHFDDFGQFILALACNTVVFSVELTWRFLGALTEVNRVLLMKQLGLLPSLESLLIEAIGPSAALAVALQGAHQTLVKLRVGSLRVNGAEDIAALARELGMLQALERISLSNIQLRAHGQNMLDAQGTMRFQEIRHQRSRVSIDPLLNALAGIPSLGSIQLQLQLDSTKFSRIKNQTIQLLCQNRSSLFLHSCNLDDDHCLAMARQLQLLDTKLTTLVLANNVHIGQKGWNALAKMLEDNCCLQNLLTEQHQYDGNTAAPAGVRDDVTTGFMAQAPSQDCWAQIEYYLKLNRAGRGLLFGDDENSYSDSVEFMIRGKDDVDVVFYALRTNPSLFVLPLQRQQHQFVL